MTWGMVDLAVRLLVAVLFLHSIGHAVRSRAGFAQFRQATAALSGIRPPLLTFLAAGVLGAQSVAAACLLTPATRQIGLGLSAALLAGFAIALAAAIRRADNTTCACFGAGDDAVRWAHVVRNVALVAMLAGTWWVEPDSRMTLASVAVAALAATVGAIVVTHLDDMLYLIDRSPATAAASGSSGARW